MDHLSGGNGLTFHTHLSLDWKSGKMEEVGARSAQDWNSSQSNLTVALLCSKAASASRICPETNNHRTCSSFGHVYMLKSVQAESSPRVTFLLSKMIKLQHLWGIMAGGTPSPVASSQWPSSLLWPHPLVDKEVLKLLLLTSGTFSCLMGKGEKLRNLS